MKKNITRKENKEFTVLNEMIEEPITEMFAQKKKKKKGRGVSHVVP